MSTGPEYAKYLRQRVIRQDEMLDDIEAGGIVEAGVLERQVGFVKVDNSGFIECFGTLDHLLDKIDSGNMHTGEAGLYDGREVAVTGPDIDPPRRRICQQAFECDAVPVLQPVPFIDIAPPPLPLLGIDLF